MSLSPIVKETVQFLEGVQFQPPLRLNSLSPSRRTVLASPVEIQQILMNLAANASLAMQVTEGPWR